MKSIMFILSLIFSQIVSAQNNHQMKAKIYQQPGDANIFFDKLQRASSINPNFIFISPVPGSAMNSPLTNIILRAKKDIDEASFNKANLISINGSISGIHECTQNLSDDRRTLLIQPNNSFVKGETVEVHLNDKLFFPDGSSVGQADFSFSISQKDFSFPSHVDQLKEERKVTANIPQSNFLFPENANTNPMRLGKISATLPSDYPQYLINGTNPSDGFIFLGNFTWVAGVTTQPYLLIIDNSGNPFFYKKSRGDCFDLKLQPSGMLTYYDGTHGKFYELDTTFSVTDSFYCQNGYWTDMHDLRILPNGHYLLIGDDFETVDMSQIVSGGKTNALVTGIIIQELDKNKAVVFQWRSWDHFKITDAASDISMTADTIDYVHTNAIEVDNDGNLIISSRHLDELTKINRQTGDIIWRMGGKNNQFSFQNDLVGFSHQHAVRRIANGDIVIFDNGNLHYSQLPSRALEYKVDESNLKAELVWQYSNSPAEYAFAMGYVQRLENGNTLIGWGATSPSVTEVTPSGDKVFELSLPKNVFSYRAYRFKLGKPYYSALVPKLIYPLSGTHVDESSVNLTWNKNKLAQNFHLQIATDTAFSNLIYNDSTLTDTTVAVKGLSPGYNYYWHVLSYNNGPNIGGFSKYSDSWNFSTGLTSVGSNAQLPHSFGMSQNFPNPFNPSTTIEFEIPTSSYVQLDVYDILGREIKEFMGEIKPAGYYQINFDAKNLPSGIYLYKLVAGSYEKTMKMMVLK